MKRKYNLLMLLAGLLELLGLLAILGGIAVIALWVMNGRTGDIGTGIASGVGLILGGLLAIVIGGAIDMVREIEFNTRRNTYYTMLLVRGQRARQANRAAQPQRRPRPAAPSAAPVQRTEPLPKG